MFFVIKKEFLREKWRKIFSFENKQKKEILCVEPNAFFFFMKKKSFLWKTKWRKKILSQTNKSVKQLRQTH